MEIAGLNGEAVRNWIHIRFRGRDAPQRRGHAAVFLKSPKGYSWAPCELEIED